ncbi:hypothetical protein BDR22DRAFT_969263 [Usnea florida]
MATTGTLPPLAYPGLPLGSSTAYIPGPGTHLDAPTSTIHASLAGRPVLIPPTPNPESQPKPTTTTTSSQSKPTISIPRLLPSPTRALIPSANVSNTNSLPRVGDVVLCRVVRISLGDQSNYYLSTARNELGVIMATSEKGNTMVPISWKEFRDTVTGEKESRKVAKPF